MNTQRARSQSGQAIAPHPVWMRLLALVCMALLAAMSTAQVCHSHDEPVSQGASSWFGLATGHDHTQSIDPASPAPDTGSAVNCPLCVAMHSALPVTHDLVTVEIIRVIQHASAAQTAKRLFLWRFALASRPPPAARLLA